MKNYQYRTLWLDACSEGHGIWLDPGELEALRSTESHFSPAELQSMLPKELCDQYRVALAEVTDLGMRLVTDQPHLPEGSAEELAMITGHRIHEVAFDPAQYQKLRG